MGPETRVRDWGQRLGSEIRVRDSRPEIRVTDRRSEIRVRGRRSEVVGQRLGSEIAGQRLGSETRVRDGLGIDLYDPRKHLGV